MYRSFVCFRSYLYRNGSPLSLCERTELESVKRIKQPPPFGFDSLDFRPQFFYRPGVLPI